MRARRLDNMYLLRLEKGEELIATLTQFVQEHEIAGAFFHGLGGGQSASLGIYQFDGDKQYHFLDFDGPLEIVSLNGNVARTEGEVLIHAHAAISGADLVVYGGHVKELIVGGTCEIWLDLRTGPLKRTHSDDIGLKLLELDDNETNQHSA